ncbi:hypothetical protein BGW36DRAFT_357069 [Talaromyces proteolyticus]|uniref:Apple domain-containing protein n=1 Tax=Talaromyces proteolyticus TaxID=1131652 RepID=A0AAD4L014_9EURO|nr:uncharacterized protein BGW36DRAFT_357069 [Talaromyces proteolyticus]KAH8700409.1 hypothetical protein BGW36DRAFT_357069 [Talaromyces proteolyticus]
MGPPDNSFFSFLTFLLFTRGVFSQNQPVFPQPGFGQQPLFPQPGSALVPVFPQPGTGQPTGGQPVFPQPGTGQPTGGQPVFPQPGTGGQPTGGQPVFPQPGTGQPTGGQPVFPQPGTGQPTGGQPVFPQPGTGQPTGGQSLFPQPGTGQPTGGQPVFPQPGAGQPVTPQPADPQYTSLPTCPDGHDLIYPAPDGAFFKLQCNYHGWHGTLQQTTANSYHECIDTCSGTDGCLAINWDTPNGNGCYLMTSDQPGNVPCPNHDFAYAVAPPTIPQQVDLTPRCTVECPGADHRQYTRSGVVFKMNCGKRHGAEYLDTQDKNSLKECMDACAELTPCHSVDYHARSKKCYLSNHQGEPTIDAPGFDSAYSIGCDGACNDKCCSDPSA